jgi:hypothetical protein
VATVQHSAPRSLTNNIVLSGGNQFFSNYSGTMAALEPGEQINVDADIGADNFAAWQDFLKSLRPLPSPNQVPDIFFNWAFLNAPNVFQVKGGTSVSHKRIIGFARRMVRLPRKCEGRPSSGWGSRLRGLSARLSWPRRRSFSNQAFNARIKLACERSRVPIISAHPLRHTAATLLLNERGRRRACGARRADRCCCCGHGGAGPIFWLHHANIDRMWNRWLAQGGGRTDATDADWLNTQFTFYDEAGHAVYLRGAEIVDTVGQLNYRYDDDPLMLRRRFPRPLATQIFAENLPPVVGGTGATLPAQAVCAGNAWRKAGVDVGSERTKR